MAKKIKKRFPKKELNAWLRLHRTWNHNEWLNLLEDLTQLGFHEWSTCGSGQKNIGFYLETRRS
ncbi:MAG: hypothetical protein H8E38_13190 [SAR324 cluster bacterium]|nr:hypothetical protein [SAR324 cluster bacterium]MBL7036019.1 hypothetical protein [SAR324 cluster bacterium]